MKFLIMKLNDIFCYVLIALFTIAGYVIGAGMRLGPNFGYLGALAGFCVAAMLSGFWFALSGIHDELRRLNATRPRL